METEQIQAEIERLRKSPHVKLAKKAKMICCGKGSTNYGALKRKVNK